jgi:hypothetical protein
VSAAIAGAVVAPRTLQAQLSTARRIGPIASSPRTPITDAFWQALVTDLQERE